MKYFRDLGHHLMPSEHDGVIRPDRKFWTCYFGNANISARPMDASETELWSSSAIIARFTTTLANFKVANLSPSSEALSTIRYLSASSNSFESVPRYCSSLAEIISSLESTC